MKYTANLIIQTTPEQKEALRQIAEEKDLNLSQLMRRIIDSYLKKQAKE